MKSYEKIARILRTDRDNIRIIEERLAAVTGKKDVMDKIIEGNETMITDRLNLLGLAKTSSAKEIYDALISKIEADDNLLFEALGRPIITEMASSNYVLNVAKEIAGLPKGFFLKKEKAVKLLKNQPPQNIISSLGYKNVDELVEKEDIFGIFSAIRFLEDADWLNDVFFKQYETLKPSDFEEREIILKTLDQKWAVAAESFVRKKYHNISHLKEMGIIFVIPVVLGISGELLRMFSLVLHYLNEIPFYSSLFKKFAANEETFADNLISLLRGDVIDRQPPSPAGGDQKSQWLIVQRYLGKDDINDWRLSFPHLNPEALHWERMERMLSRAGDLLDGFAVDLAFWQNLNWVGDYFKDETGIEVLVSFNLVDTVMSLVMEKELVKYFYHHQESLWNRIFIEYFGEEKMEETIKENIIKGWFEI
ncbi:MAG: Glycosidase related protein [Candidatus Wolfebacteria bacterium GW2011_GWA2_42_10]|uniref:Glycosidase related protein n=2 Tax=Candidatus Wolfeibacteriota TaxID=1752735 RepID=A0A0G0XKN5_9BACT|nr:MAG: Glycosidase related protein [Candidatus Wolfebacteria bacterium GW2011_GWB1_41_12]KKS25464.1 MAG: Glycosidase related protein [Candidatus Wolfebacteria bacterium GW2011_GWA2_42_10]KKT56641.1 MAG: Glycosidase related protein [Candidatus Wolfebacteria bacterium GW2011_GWA1_44_24]